MRNVQSARGDVRCHQNPEFSLPKTGNDFLAAALAQIAVNGVGSLIFLCQFLSQTFGAIFGLNENQHRAFAVLKLVYQFAVFGGVRGFDKFLTDIGCRGGCCSDGNPHRIVQIFA